jgi:AcrR family transcriptional regulator
MTVSEHNVELLEKNRPQQQRAIKTYEAILSAAGELLCEVGLERISTNNIAERAGVTVPALYRYFPNKYAVINALAGRLLEVQTEVFVSWYRLRVEGRGVEGLLDGLEALLRDLYRVTRDFPGGLELIYGMQAMTPLQEVQQKSHWSTAEQFAQMWSGITGDPVSEEVQQRARMALSMGFMTIQMALEDKRMNPEITLHEGARALRTYLDNALVSAKTEVD